MKRLTADQVKAGFIGLGNMGSRIAQRLLDHGYQVSVYDRNRAQTEAVAAHGGVVAKNILELARTSDVVLSCLTNDEAVQSVYSGPDGVFAGARPGTVVLEMSTISPETSRELHTARRQKWRRRAGCRHFRQHSCRRSRNPHVAGWRRLEFFEAAEPIFQAIAKQYFLLGGPGSGTAMKLVVNTLLGIGMQAIAEAVVLGEKAGLDRGRLLEVLSKTAVVAPAHVGKLARVAINDYSPQFPLRLMNKDFRLILEAAAQEHVGCLRRSRVSCQRR